MGVLRCGGGEAEQTQQELVRSVPVEARVLKPRKVTFNMSATGTVLPFQDVIVSSETSGTIDTLLVEVGNRVMPKSVIATVDRELKELAVQQSEAQVIKAHAMYEKALKDLERMEQLVKTNDISQSEYDAAAQQKESARGDLQMAEASLKTAERHLRDTWIRSPIHGYVAKRYVEVGTSIVPGTNIAKIIDLRKVKISIGVAETDMGRIRLGQRVSVTVDGAPGKEYTGSIYTIGPEADESTRTFPIEVLVANDSDMSLKSRMVADVFVMTKTLEDVLMVPQDAVLELGNKRWVFVVKDSTARRRDIVLGKPKDEEVLVTEGLNPGDTVVVVGERQLIDGARVEVTIQP